MTLYLGDTPIANTGYDKANINLSNLTNTGKNIANWSNNVTNCVTEIPQDIKLELNNGTLTLKAGSKVYIPNGFETNGTTPKFDVIVIESDLTYTKTSVNTGKSILFLYPNLTLGAFTAGGDSTTRFYFSGNTTPSNIETYGLWYDTANNLIKNTSNSGSTWTSGCTIPLAIFSYDTGVTSIDQVFNGFGYIGSTVFALPGVKGLVPNGRNADGSLKNTTVVLNTVLTYTEPTSATTPIYIRINNDRILFGSSTPSTRYYDEQTNYNYWGGSINSMAWIGKSQLTSGKVTSFTPKTVFHALDWNDLKTLPNYDSSTTQILKHVNGVLQWG